MCMICDVCVVVIVVIIIADQHMVELIHVEIIQFFFRRINKQQQWAKAKMILIDKWLHRNSMNRLKCNFGNFKMTIFKQKCDFTLGADGTARQTADSNLYTTSNRRSVGLSFLCLMKRISIKIQLSDIQIEIFDIWNICDEKYFLIPDKLIKT